MRAKVYLKPLVFFQIIDAYDRRPKGDNQVGVRAFISCPLIL